MYVTCRRGGAAGVHGRGCDSRPAGYLIPRGSPLERAGRLGDRSRAAFNRRAVLSHAALRRGAGKSWSCVRRTAMTVVAARAAHPARTTIPSRVATRTASPARNEHAQSRDQGDAGPHRWPRRRPPPRRRPLLRVHIFREMCGAESALRGGARPAPLRHRVATELRSRLDSLASRSPTLRLSCREAGTDGIATALATGGVTTRALAGVV